MNVRIAMLIINLITVGCAERDSAHSTEFAGKSFTLQMHDQNDGKGKAKVKLMLCQGEVCKNPLLKAGGKGEYLFDDHYSVYKDGQKNANTGNRVRTALLWGSLLAGLSSVWFYIKSDRTRKVLVSKYESIQASVKRVHKIDGEIARLEGKESLTTNAFYASEIAIVSTALASIVTSNRNNAEDALKQKLTDLLVHKQPVHVTRDELKNILDSLTELIPAVIDASTKKNVMNS